MIVTNALYAEIDRLKAENKKLIIKTSNSLANNLCPDHRDKQAGKPCLACEIDRLAARVGELEVERDELDHIAVTICKQKNELEAENRRLRSLVDGVTEVVEIFPCTSPAQMEWKYGWLRNAREALKEASHE